MNRRNPEQPFTHGPKWLMLLFTQTRQSDQTEYTELKKKQSTKCRGQLKCDGTSAETRFCLSAKRRSPFKPAGASVQSTTGSRGVRMIGSNAGYTMFRGNGYPLHSPVSPFTSPARASLCAITFQLESTTNCSAKADYLKFPAELELYQIPQTSSQHEVAHTYNSLALLRLKCSQFGRRLTTAKICVFINI